MTANVKASHMTV